MLTVGSSTDKAGKASIADGSHNVSEIFNLSIPVMHTIEPASALET